MFSYRNTVRGSLLYLISSRTIFFFFCTIQPFISSINFPISRNPPPPRILQTTRRSSNHPASSRFRHSLSPLLALSFSAASSGAQFFFLALSSSRRIHTHTQVRDRAHKSPRDRGVAERAVAAASISLLHRFVMDEGQRGGRPT